MDNSPPKYLRTPRVRVDPYSHRTNVVFPPKGLPSGKYFGQVKTPKGPRHRLQAASRGVQYVKGVHGLPNDHQLPTTAIFKIPRSFHSRASRR
eukprot:6044571-Pyramimonas_sp.AAC.1